MKRGLMSAAIGGSLLLSATAAWAGPATDRFGSCLVENASPKDQAALIRWMFMGLSANPLLSNLSAITPEQRTTYNKAIAATFERLVLDDCRSEYVAASKAEGSAALEAAFRVMGERAAGQLMSDPSASKELENFTAYLDEARWQEAADAGRPD